MTESLTSFTPHVTLIKSRGKKLPSELLQACQYHEKGMTITGTHAIETVYLLSMQEQDDDGGYKCYCKIDLKSKKVEVLCDAYEMKEKDEEPHKKMHHDTSNNKTE